MARGGADVDDDRLCARGGGGRNQNVHLHDAGDEARGKEVVLGLVAALGFEAVDAGGITVARLLEPYATLWIHLMARRNMGRRFAFGLLRR